MKESKPQINELRDRNIEWVKMRQAKPPIPYEKIAEQYDVSHWLVRKKVLVTKKRIERGEIIL